jgi:hypothetical protein
MGAGSAVAEQGSTAPAPRVRRATVPAMRYEISEGDKGRFEMDLDKLPAEGDFIPRGNMASKVTALVREATKTSQGIIEVERVTGPGQYAP